MSSFLVSWEIDIEDVESPVEAASRALIIQRDVDSTAVVFKVKNKETGEEQVIDIAEPLEQDTCLCQGFYTPPNCPVHGREGKKRR